MKKVFLFVILLASLHASAQNPGTYKMTLQECIDYGMQNNLNKQITDIGKETAQTVLEQSEFERLPSLSANASEKFTNTPNSGSQIPGIDTPQNTFATSVGVQANMTLYNGGVINNKIKQNKVKAEQADYQIKQYDNQLAVNIIEAFLSILSNDEMIRYQEQLIKTSEKQLTDGKAQREAEIILESDYMLLSAQYESNKNDLETSKIQRNNNMTTLKYLLSMPVEADLSITAPDTSVINKLALIPEREKVITDAVNTMPDIKVAEYDTEAAKYDIKAAKAGYMPSLNLNGGLGTMSNSYSGSAGVGKQFKNNLNEYVGLTLNVPIFSNHRNKANVKLSEFKLKQTELQQLQTQRDIERQAENEYNSVLSAYGKYVSSDIKHKAYKASYDAYNTKFEVGTITTVTLLQQQDKYISAINDYLQNKYTFILQRKILDIYMGLPVEL